MTDYTKEIQKRRTFAIISHPDAGKTTLTEKFLLYGGAINLAGSVKGKATARHAVSDWMEIEKERGISVTSSVLQFNYDGYCINILDTPGHQDFSEDTYRTLMAADSAVMVIDASKGVEAQTRKLFKVCAMRHIPIFTFINKMDRDANDTFELLDDIEKELGIPTCPVNWPIGSGKKFRGVYDRDTRKVLTFSDTMKGTKEGHIEELDVDDAKIDEVMDPDQKEQLMDEIELLDGASAEFDMKAVSCGKLSPVFFGSALTNFGVETFLQHFLTMTTSPLPRTADCGVIDPMTEDFSAFVFKIQANMNKAHRDRIAFMRICSGKFDAGMEVYHVQGDKKMRLSQPQQMMAQDRHIVEEAYAGDIIGVFDPGIFSIGDTVCTPGNKFAYEKEYARSNTMFKLTYQAFTMFGILFGYALIRLWMEKRHVIRKILTSVVFACFVGCCFYTVTAVHAWFGQVWNPAQYQGLDATAYLETTFPEDAAAIRWLNEHVTGDPVVLEANGDSYSDYERVSAMTGLPTVLGWYVHEWLWRGDTGALNERAQEVEAIYTSTNQEEVKKLLEKYRVRYIFVGAREREKYAALNESMLQSLGNIVFSDEQSQTYVLQVAFSGQ